LIGGAEISQCIHCQRVGVISPGLSGTLPLLLGDAETPRQTANLKK